MCVCVAAWKRQNTESISPYKSARSPPKARSPVDSFPISYDQSIIRRAEDSAHVPLHLSPETCEPGPQVLSHCALSSMASGAFGERLTTALLGAARWPEAILEGPAVVCVCVCVCAGACVCVGLGLTASSCWRQHFCGVFGFVVLPVFCTLLRGQMHKN